MAYNKNIVPQENWPGCVYVALYTYTYLCQDLVGPHPSTDLSRKGAHGDRI